MALSQAILNSLSMEDPIVHRPSGSSETIQIGPSISINQFKIGSVARLDTISTVDDDSHADG